MVANYSLDTWFITEFNLDVWIFKFAVLGETFGKEAKNTPHLYTCEAFKTWLYESPCTHNTNTGLQASKNSTRPVKAHQNALETMAVYHSTSCYSINMLHESTVNAASGDDTGSKTKKWCMLHPLPNSSALKTEAVPSRRIPPQHPLPGQQSRPARCSAETQNPTQWACRNECNNRKAW